MQTVVLVLMILTAFNFLLKQTFHRWYYILAVTLLMSLFTGLMWPAAIEQSKSQIATWLENSTLMLDTSVLLTIEVFVQMGFCLLAAQQLTGGMEKKSVRWIYRVLWLFPGILIFAVLFSLLVGIIFLFPGVSFAAIAWSLAATILVVIPLGTWLLGWLLPEPEIRLELLFLTNALVAVLGIVATVNGRTAVEGFNEVNWPALAAMLGLLFVGGATGLLCRKYTKKV